MLTETDRQKIQKYLLRQKNLNVAYLFGSQVTGKSNSLSDIDIAVLFDKKLSKEHRFTKKLEIAGDLETLLKTNAVEVVDLNSAPIPLRFSAIEKRDILVNKNNLERCVFEADTMSRYQDYKYYQRENTYISLNSISNMPM